jgi:membrane associated rhomboid family serine protease
MYVLWIFGTAVESTFSNKGFFPETYQYGKFFYMLMYVLAVPISTIPALFKHKNDHYYNSVGASGAVSAIVFTTILLAPGMKLGIIFIPIGIPAYIFGILYLVYSYFMSRRGQDNIAHDAHFVGSVFGFIFPIMLNHELFKSFINQII